MIQGTKYSELELRYVINCSQALSALLCSFWVPQSNIFMGTERQLK